MNIQENLSKWLRPAIHESQFNSEWYEKRLKTIESIIDEISVFESLKLLRYSLNKASEAEVNEIESKIQGDDLAYEKGNDFLNRLIIDVCIINILNEPSDSSDAISLAISTYYFQDEFFNAETEVEKDLYRIAKDYLINECVRMRESNISFSKLKDIEKKNIKLADSKKGLEALQPIAADLTKIVESMFDLATKLQDNYVGKASAVAQAFNNETEKIYKQIRISREETNFLWWLFGEYSRDLNKPMAEISLPLGCLLIGKEAADLTEILPAHQAAKAFVNRALKLLTSEKDGTPRTRIAFSSVIEDESEEWVVEGISSDEVNNVLDFCPIHQAMKNKLESDNSSWRRLFENKSNFKTNQKFEALDISCQFYQERLLIRLTS